MVGVYVFKVMSQLLAPEKVHCVDDRKSMDHGFHTSQRIFVPNIFSRPETALGARTHAVSIQRQRTKRRKTLLATASLAPYTPANRRSSVVVQRQSCDRAGDDIRSHVLRGVRMFIWLQKKPSCSQPVP